MDSSSAAETAMKESKSDAVTRLAEVQRRRRRILVLCVEVEGWKRRMVAVDSYGTCHG